MMRFEYPGVTRDQAMRWRMKRLFKADDDTDDAHAAALDYLLHTKHGAADLRRVFPRGVTSVADLESFAQRVAQIMRMRAVDSPPPRDPHQPWPDAKPEVTAKGFPMNRADELTTLVKRAGSFAGLCKRVSAGAHGDITERELALLAKGYAMNEYPGLSPELAFTKKFGDERMSSESRAFWDACGVIKGLTPARTEPEVTSGRNATAVNDPAETLRQLRELLTEQHRRTRVIAGDGDEDSEHEDEDDALDEITEKARKLRKSMPHLSEAQAFTKVYEQNRELAKRERRQNGF
jgi:hypothetical protein